MLVLPEELKPLFDRYRGTGRFTVSAVSEYVRKWNTIKTAKEMDPIQWIEYAFNLSERNGLVNEDRRKYMDDNMDFWMEIWRYANEGMIYFSRRNAGAFVSEGMISMVERAIYDHSEGIDENRKDDWIFDLVKINA